ncbi:MAG: hypothetical protein MRY76_07575 [Pseudomonadales bacterium]|jgi:hypothetical protein|nr:hypothetical protein [Pseudomonadales bacterium]
MTLFEFMMAIASVVIAIALTEMFGGWGNLLRAHIAPQIDWLHLCWSVVVVLYAIQYWMGIWPYRVQDFNFIYQVWFLIIPTLFIVLVSFAITPDVGPDDTLRLRDYYMSRRAPIFFGLAIFVTTAQLADLVIQGSGFSLIGVSLIGSLIIPALSTAVWMHFAVMLYNLYFLVQVAFTPTISAL